MRETAEPPAELPRSLSWSEAIATPCERREPTGTEWFDMLTGGGLFGSGGEVISLVGGLSWGTTTASIQLATGLALLGRPVVYFTYDDSIVGPNSRSMWLRFVACASGIPIKQLDDELQPGLVYEQKALRVALDQLDKNLCLYDMTGGARGAGDNGVPEIVEIIRKFRDARNGESPALVVVDTFDAMAMNDMKLHPSGDLPPNVAIYSAWSARQLQRAARDLGTNFLLTQTGVVLSRGPNAGLPARPEPREMELGMPLTFCIAMMPPKPDGRTSFHEVRRRLDVPIKIEVQRDSERNLWNVLDAVGIEHHLLHGDGLPPVKFSMTPRPHRGW